MERKVKAEVTGRAGSMASYAIKCIREFTETGWEACELSDKDLGRYDGYNAKQNSNGAYYNAAYSTRIIRDQIKALDLESIVDVVSNEGHLYLVRKDI